MSEMSEMSTASYEVVEELCVGDFVEVCEADDGSTGFYPGERGVVLEMDTSTTFPYLVKSRDEQPTEKLGFFKASALRLSQRRRPVEFDSASSLAKGSLRPRYPVPACTAAQQPLSPRAPDIDMLDLE